MSFIHLHVASAYSLKYGTTQPADLVARAREFNMPALAVTDRDGLAGAIRFAQSCVAEGIAPIIGVDLAIKLPGFTDKKLPRLTLLANGDGGWRSLCRFMTSLPSFWSVFLISRRLSRRMSIGLHPLQKLRHCSGAE